MFEKLTLENVKNLTGEDLLFLKYEETGFEEYEEVLQKIPSVGNLNPEVVSVDFFNFLGSECISRVRANLKELPEFNPNVVLIVPQEVAQANRNRVDLIVPEDASEYDIEHGAFVVERFASYYDGEVD